LREIKEQNLVPEFPNFEVYVDSPLAIEATKVFVKNEKSCFDEEAMKVIQSGVNPLVFPGLKLSVTSDDSKLINFDPNPKVIISASGMCEAGRIRHHLKHNLWRPESTILFVGYQAVGTLGRKLIEGANAVKLFGENIEVSARIESLKGISGHADMKGLLDWLGGFETPIKHVFVVHGEDAVTDEFAQTIRETYGWNAFAPYSGGCVDLATNEILNEGIRIAKKKDMKPTRKRAQEAFERLVAACKRLMAVVMKCEGMANKDLAKFEGQIQNLIDKWDVKD
jgi:metallo-beta-lactamase family protein